MKYSLGLLFALAFFGSSIHADEVSAKYVVPAPEALSAYATFTDAKAQWASTEEGKAKLTFTLPEDLALETAEQIQLTQSGPAHGALIPLQGQKGTGSCLKTEQTVTCLMQLHYDFPTTQDIETFLSHKYAGAPDLDKRIAVAKLFGSEPSGGVLMFSLNRN